MDDACGRIESYGAGGDGLCRLHRTVGKNLNSLTLEVPKAGYRIDLGAHFAARFIGRVRGRV